MRFSLKFTDYFLYFVLFIIFTAALPAFSLISDNSSLVRPQRSHLQGVIKDDHYYAHENLFSIVLPAKAETLVIEDFYMSANIGGVAFLNDSGFFLKVEVDELLPEVAHLIATYPEIKPEMLDILFDKVLLVQLKTMVPGLHLLHKRNTTLTNGEHALFAVIDLPETATLVNMQTGRNLDAKRGYLLFFSSDNQKLVSMSLQDTLSLIPGVAEAAKARLNERLLNHLMRYQSTFRMPAVGII